MRLPSIPWEHLIKFVLKLWSDSVRRLHCNRFRWVYFIIFLSQWFDNVIICCLVHTLAPAADFVNDVE